MTAIYKLVTLLGFLLPVRKVHLRTHGCQLQPSDLGPDWYKVTQPVPAGFENIPDYETHFIHMPCAIATVFDEGICGCTNLEAYLFSGIKSISEQPHKKPQDPYDFVKERDPDDFSPPPKKSGSILLNTRTGEVTHCPFRASSRGSMWYLVREPTDVWRPMKCAPGTVFDKRACTCIHLLFASREPAKPEDLDIVVLEDEYDDGPAGNTLSRTLQIKASDVDFGSGPSADPSKSWLEQTLEQNRKQNRPTDEHKPIVVSFPGENGFNKGLDETVNDRLPKVGQASVNIQRTSPLFLDSFQTINGKRDNGFLTSNNNVGNSLVFRPFDFNPASEKDFGVQLSDAEITVVKKKESISNTQDPKYDTIPGDNNIAGVQFIGKQDRPSNTEFRSQETDQGKGPADEVYFPLVECTKKPIPELGPEFFTLYLWGVGWIPYACHGDRVYNDLLCACVPATD